MVFKKKKKFVGKSLLNGRADTRVALSPDHDSFLRSREQVTLTHQLLLTQGTHRFRPESPKWRQTLFLRTIW